MLASFHVKAGSVAHGVGAVARTTGAAANMKLHSFHVKSKHMAENIGQGGGAILQGVSNIGHKVATKVTTSTTHRPKKPVKRRGSQVQ
jgi:hypothetical protein